jgi:NB-ARC domain
LHVLLDIAKTSPGANINDVMAQVKSALDRNTKLTNALQTDTRMLQINLGQSKGYQVLVEGNATAYIGDRYELDTDAVIKALGKLLDEIALNQSPVGTPQNLPRSGVVEFVGRDVKLIELHEQLQSNKRIAITAIAGMGGIGKTELALQYAIEQLQQGQYPAGICWLRARDREIATDIVTFAQVHLGLSLPDQMEIEDQVRFCWQRWPEGEALVVLDDVTDYQAIEPYLPPADPRFKLLITTRLDLGSTVQKVSLEELDEYQYGTVLIFNYSNDSSSNPRYSFRDSTPVTFAKLQFTVYKRSPLSSISGSKSKANSIACFIFSITSSDSFPNLRSNLTVGIEPIPCTLATES